MQAKMAKPFFAGFREKDLDDTLRKAVFLSEIGDMEGPKAWSVPTQNLALRLEKQASTLPYRDNVSNYVNRILRSSSGSSNLPWIHKTAQTWAKDHNEMTCQMLYVTYAKMANTNAHPNRQLFDEIQGFIAHAFPALLKSDHVCALNYLDLEEKTGRSFAKDYAKTWLARLDWPMDRQVVASLWLASETFAASGDNDNAKKLWTFLSEKAPHDFPETRFAALRLNPTIPETQRFWSQ
jgi:hypothetical protein